MVNVEGFKIFSLGKKKIFQFHLKIKNFSGLMNVSDQHLEIRI